MATDDPADISADIARRRAELARTLEELQGDAAPNRLATDAAGLALREGGKLLGKAGGALRRNPVAGALIVAGVALMLLDLPRPSGSRGKNTDRG